ncbi:MAG: FeoB-associated Cys-rich membrane protein [Roseburia sp.]|nr:FeoB-associated Cys-rich membrane protein [Roseburia sp.]
MGIWDYLLCGLLLLWFAAVIRHLRKKKKAGMAGCGSCSGCGGCAGCGKSVGKTSCGCGSPRDE